MSSNAAKAGAAKAGRHKECQKPGFGLLFDGSGRAGEACGDRGQLSLGFLNENSTGTKIERALRTVENVLLKLFARIGSKLIEEVSFRGHLFYCFAMIHDSLSVHRRKCQSIAGNFTHPDGEARGFQRVSRIRP